MDSPFFLQGKLNSQLNKSLIYSLFKLLTVEIFIPKDLIIIGGDINDKIYFLLEGNVELISFNLKKNVVIKKGEFFGGVLNYERQPGYAQAL